MPRLHSISALSALVLSLAVTTVLRADEPAPADAAPAELQGADSLVQLSRGTQTLYRKISPSLIRVRIDQGFQAMLSQPQRREFNEWLREQQANAPANPPAAQAARPMLALFRKFLELKLSDPQLTPEDARIWKYIQNRLQQPVQETTGIIVDAQGDALLLGTWVKDGQPLSIRVTLPDGTETNAKYVGGHPTRGLAIIKLDSAGAAPALSLAQDAPAPGDLLMCMSATSGGIGLDIAPGPAQKRNNGEQRFAIYGNEERGPILVINTNGQLTAVGADRFALPVSFLKHDIQWIIDNKRDIVPRQLGVTYAPVTQSIRKSARLLANRPAVIVEDVTAGSLAEKAGLKKDDIVITIDHRPIIQLPQIQADMATETAPVPIGILRDNKEVTLSMPLD
jgi:S1-C subfamily serine protease